MKRNININEFYKLAAAVQRHNHYGYIPGDYMTDDIIYYGARLGVELKRDESGKIHVTYGRSADLDATETYERAVEALTTSRKRNPTPRYIRRERKEAEKSAAWHNVERYRPITPWFCATKSALAEEARNLRNLKAAAGETRRDKAQNTLYWTHVTADRDVARRGELEARMNYPEQVERNLLGQLIDNPYNPDLPF